MTLRTLRREQTSCGRRRGSVSARQAGECDGGSDTQGPLMPDIRFHELLLSNRVTPCEWRSVRGHEATSSSDDECQAGRKRGLRSCTQVEVANRLTVHAARQNFVSKKLWKGSAPALIWRKNAAIEV